MKVILEAQHAVGHPELRGVGNYALNLTRALLKRGAFDYGLTLFDCNREMGNLARAERYFGEFGVPLHECCDLDYRTASRDDSVFKTRSYNDYTGTNGDLYHFMCPVSIPTNLRGKMVLTIHDMFWESNPEAIPEHTAMLHKIATRRFNALQPHIIADSESARQEILKFSAIPDDNIDVVYLSCDEEKLYPDKADVSHLIEGEYFLFIGAFEKRKNLPRIIRAFDIVAERDKDIKLAIVGKRFWADSEELSEALDASPNRDRIVFTGYVSNDEKRQLYSNARCFLFPSLAEGFGIPVLEAMACGCPVITSDSTSLPEVGGDAALYVNAYDTEQLSYQMERVLLSDTLREDLIARGFLQKQRFSWDKTAQQVEEVYRKVLSE